MARKRSTDYDGSMFGRVMEKNESPVIEETKRPKARKGIVVGTEFLRVRNRPSIAKSEVISVLQKGDEVRILDDAENRFYKIELSKEEIGYISSKFCEEVE